MRKRFGVAGAAVALWSLLVPTASQGLELRGPFVHAGMCEPSGAVNVVAADGSRSATFVVANDEDNELRVYADNQDGPPLDARGGDLNAYLGLDPADENDKADLEAAARLGDRVYWLGSHSRSGKGKVRKQRQRFFATVVRAAGAGVFVIEPAAVASFELLDAIISLDSRFKDAAHPDIKEDVSLAPERGGLNIEALAARPDERSMFLGLRSPLSANGKAYVVPFENPAEVVDTGARPVLGSPIELDLGGRGIRSMEQAPGEKAFYIVAGPAGATGTFDLYRWSGRADDRAWPVPGAAAAFASQNDFNPEALMVDAAGKQFYLLSDDGDRQVQGTACKKLPFPEQRAFRSFLLVLD